MHGPLTRLVYYSRNAMPGSREEIIAGIRQILDTSRRNNAAAGVTGALMFNSGCFVQVLEGERQAVTATFERIQQDLRHTEVVVLQYTPVEAREFPNWSMSFVGERALDAASFGGLGAESGFDSARLEAEQVLAMLQRLVREEEAAAA